MGLSMRERSTNSLGGQTKVVLKAFTDLLLIQVFLPKKITPSEPKMKGNHVDWTKIRFKTMQVVSSIAAASCFA